MLNKEIKELLDFTYQHTGKKFSSIIKTSEYKRLYPSFFVEKGYEVVFEYVDILSSYSQTLIKYSETVYLFFIIESDENILYFISKSNNRNEFNLFVSNLKTMKNE